MSSKSLSHQPLNQEALPGSKSIPTGKKSHATQASNASTLPWNGVTAPPLNESVISATTFFEAALPQASRIATPAVIVTGQGTKRRLGMGRGGTGYSNKKFKLPT
ncbi:hypothetical protein BDZ94DRAFT_838105 [Collybia nuda]|uniref:Uncharacterized protein n=1 Tax=Collybia nuda TaxID=64659 RepID=A0A9P5YHS0_9AGAR|nr:hypothetical protein BDZ94DRAFT_838105 [Collybia nuda]